MRRGAAAALVGAAAASWGAAALADRRRIRRDPARSALDAPLRGEVLRVNGAVIAGHSLGGMTIAAWAQLRGAADRASAIAFLNTGMGDLIDQALLLRTPSPLAAVRGAAGRALLSARDRLTPPVHAKRLAADLPQLLRYIEVDGSGHMTPLERPHVVSDLLAQLSAAPATVAA